MQTSWLKTGEYVTFKRWMEVNCPTYKWKGNVVTHAIWALNDNDPEGPGYWCALFRKRYFTWNGKEKHYLATYI